MTERQKKTGQGRPWRWRGEETGVGDGQGGGEERRAE